MWHWLGFSHRWTSGAWRWAAFSFGVFLAILIATAADRGTSALGSAIPISAIYVGIAYMFPRFVSVSSIGVNAGSAVGAVVAAFAGSWELAGVLAAQSAAYYGLMWLGWKIYSYKVARAARWEARAQLADARSIGRHTGEYAMQQQMLRNNALAMMQRQAINDSVASVVGGWLIARGEAHPMFETTPEMVGPGRAVVEPNGPLFFTLDSSGSSHSIDRKHIASVKPTVDDDAPPGTLVILFKPPILILGISIHPLETDRERWLALAPGESTPS